MLEICGDTVGDRVRGPPCFLLAGDMVGNAPIMSSFLFGHSGLHYSISVAEKVSYSFRRFPKSWHYILGTAQMISKCC
jgi:hypothetical protein